MADDYIQEFVGRQKEKSERERQQREEAMRAAQRVLHEKVLVDTNAPEVWRELEAYIQQKVSEINAATGSTLLSVPVSDATELVLQGETKFLRLEYVAETHAIQVEGSFAIKRRWRSLQAVPDGEQVRFAENTTRGFVPLSPDEIMKGLLASFTA